MGHGDVDNSHSTLKWVLQLDSTLTWISLCPWIGTGRGDVFHCLVTQVKEVWRLNTNLLVFYDFKATMRTYFNFWVEESVPPKSQSTDWAFSHTIISSVLIQILTVGTEIEWVEILISLCPRTSIAGFKLRFILYFLSDLEIKSARRSRACPRWQF